MPDLPLVPILVEIRKTFPSVVSACKSSKREVHLEDMRLDEIPSELKECLAAISTLSSLGIPADKCSLLITRIKDFDGVYYVVSADLVVGGEDATFSCALVPCVIEPEEALKAWQEASDAWNMASEAEREEIWRSTEYFKNDITATVQALVEMGFDITIDGITYKSENIVDCLPPECEEDMAATQWN